jgi:hypothetical protein
MYALNVLIGQGAKSSYTTRVYIVIIELMNSEQLKIP